MPYSEAFLSKKFDFLYRRACALMAKHDPCQIRGQSCHSMRLHPELHVNDPFCCQGCQYLKPEGCSVQSLLCKLWMCPILEEAHGVKKPSASHLARRIERIKKVAAKYDLLVPRGSREDSIRQARSGRLKISDVLKMYQ